MDMTDEQINALMDELQAAQKRADDAEAKCEKLVEAIDWLAIGIDPLTSDDFIPDAHSNSLMADDGPITAKDAAFGAALYAVRHGIMVAFSTLRNDAPGRVEDMARKLAADSLNIHDPDLAEQSIMQMLKMAMYIKGRGVEGAAGEALKRFPL
jgi:hypothetical protein